MKIRKIDILAAIVIAAMVWLSLSWFEVASKNLQPEPTYSSFNLFEVFK